MDEDEYKLKLKHVAAIAHPLATAKLCPKVLKLCKKATKAKQVKRGVKEVVKAIRKKNKGLVVLAGDISPIDVITHVPVLCEDNDIPYVYVPAKEYLANASETRRPTSCLMILPKPIKATDAGPDEAFTKLYKTVHKKMAKLEHIPH